MPALTCRRVASGVALAAAFTAPLLTTSAIAAPPTDVPFSASSPFNQLVPPNPPIAANSGNLNSALGMQYSSWTPSVYTSNPSDPLVTIRLTAGWGPNALNGLKVHVDTRAHPSSDSDGHVTIVIPDQDLVVSLYQAKAPSGGVLTATWGGMAHLSGTGANMANSPGGRESGISQLAGLITPDDVRRGLAEGANGDLGHALSLVHHTVSNQAFVAPAISPGGLFSRSDALLMGQRVFLDPTVSVASLPCKGTAQAQAFCRLVAHTLQRYGAITVTNSSNFTGFQMVNPNSYTSIGQANPWPALVGPDNSGFYNAVTSAIPLQKLHPMAGQGIPQQSHSSGSGSSGGTGSTGSGAGSGSGSAQTPANPATGRQPVPVVGGVTVTRRIQFVNGVLHTRIQFVATKRVNVRVRFRIQRPDGLGPRRRLVAVRRLFPGTTTVLTMKLSGEGSPKGDLAIWLMRSGTDVQLLDQTVKLTK